MALQLEQAVGPGRPNNSADAKRVQNLLVKLSEFYDSNSMHPGPVDGKPGFGTFGAISEFQKYFMWRPDAVVDTGGRTFRPMVAQAAVSDVAAGFCFPVPAGFPKKDDWHWTKGMRAYGAPRSGGRAHAGSDIYAPVGTALHALADGTVVRGPYSYYMRTDALHLKFGNLEVIYGEIAPNSATVKAGDTVKRRQKIAEVGALIKKNGRRLGVPSMMLHIETYDGTASGNIGRAARTGAKTSLRKPFKRRIDLFNSAFSLNACEGNRP